MSENRIDQRGVWEQISEILGEKIFFVSCKNLCKELNIGYESFMHQVFLKYLQIQRVTAKIDAFFRKHFPFIFVDQQIPPGTNELSESNILTKIFINTSKVHAETMTAKMKKVFLYILEKFFSQVISPTSSIWGLKT